MTPGDPTAAHILHERFADPMRGVPARTALTVLVLASLLSAIPASTAHAEGDPEHWHIDISLGDDSQTNLTERPDVVTYRFHGSLVVQEDPTGAGAHNLRFPLPDDARLLEFGIANGTGQPETVDEDGAPAAHYTWAADEAPSPGTIVHNVTLMASRAVDVAEPFAVRWAGLHADNVTVRLELPNGYTITSGRQLLPQTAHAPAGRKVWHQSSLTSSVLEVNVRTTYQGADPAFSDPPNPAGGFLIIAGIAIVSGGAWVLGKRLEARHKHAEADEAAERDAEDPTRS